ncbi:MULTISPECIES: hypothetical protein [Methylosinus]|uniref:hypothetical protein n=1 Tax=Methylosinus TaxID=425 RepID=UPI0001D2E38E|nr:MULTISPECIES: hypothetical protein [Methylosinus]OBS54443.1 hypothetical protein A8B73_00575 [Methylosinus sp. 3S-1]
MISVSECAAIAGLASNELVLGAAPSAKHRSLLTSYLLNAHKGLDTVRGAIVADLRRFLDLGVPARAADLLIVLRMLLTLHPAARWPALALAHAEPLEARRHDAVVLAFSRRPRRVEPSEPRFFESPNDPIYAKRRARSAQLRRDS